jgi:hypothetical protein
VNRIYVFSFLIVISISANSQKPDSLKMPFVATGSVTINTQGISTFPNLSLGKPAAIFDLTLGRRLTFEPSMRFALEGRPWTFIFWWRYKLVQNERFRLSLGGHPALSFKMQNIQTNNGEKEIMAVYRYLATEVAPTFVISKNITAGVHYIYSRGVEEVLVRNSNFVALRSAITNIKIAGDYFFRLNPQVYYLNMDGIDGIYLNGVAGLSKRNFPLSVAALVNSPITTDIAAGNKFLWNLGLIYSFQVR